MIRYFFRYGLTLLALIALSGCSQQSHLVRWDAPLIKDISSAEPVTYWDNGDQYYLISTDHLDVSISGFVNAKYLVIVFAMTNTSSDIIHFYPQECTVFQDLKKGAVPLHPLRPSKLDEQTLNYLASTSALSILSLALTGNRQTSANIKYNQEVVKTANDNLKAKLAKNHTLFPNSHFSGYLCFEKGLGTSLSGGVNIEKSFMIKMLAASDSFTVRGRVPSHDKYDGMESASDLKRIGFLNAKQNDSSKINRNHWN